MADVDILNTDAELTGSLLIDADDAQTIEGLKTFSRAPNAPFAVEAGSAKVDNLDADKLDGQDGSFYQDGANLTADSVSLDALAHEAWASAAVTVTNITLGTGGTATATFTRIGRTALMKFAITLGAGGSFGASGNQLNLPAELSSNGVFRFVGGTAVDANGSSYPIEVTVSATAVTFVVMRSDGTYVVRNSTTATVPFTWTDGDSLTGVLVFETAA